jgi:quinol monooxygenase YgiN
MVGRASDEEALRLVIAFYCIMEPDKRAEVLALAERLAKESRVVDGVTHFLMLDNEKPRND